jgi:ankyrin repeat protein
MIKKITIIVCLFSLFTLKAMEEPQDYTAILSSKHITQILSHLDLVDDIKAFLQTKKAFTILLKDSDTVGALIMNLVNRQLDGRQEHWPSRETLEAEIAVYQAWTWESRAAALWLKQYQASNKIAQRIAAAMLWGAFGEPQLNKVYFSLKSGTYNNLASFSILLEEMKRQTPLMIAIEHGNKAGVALLKALLQVHADVNALDSNNETALHRALNALLKAKNPESKEALTEMIKLLLAQEGINVKARNKEGKTPLMLAVNDLKDPTLVKLLIEVGAELPSEMIQELPPLI